jgi:hypothetical protein
VAISNQIKHISYLDKNGNRHRIEADVSGMFRIRSVDEKGKERYGYTFGAWEVVSKLLAWNPECDPVATLTDRSSVRICQGGRGRPRVDAECVLEAHDKHFGCRRFGS